MDGATRSSQTSFNLKLADFGLACYYDPENPLTDSCGSLITVAPEILRLESYGPPVDMWSLGIILY